MTIENFVARLEGAKRKSGGWVARCPAHDDRHASLNIKEGADARILVLCRSRGCDLGAILAAMGLAERDLFADGGERPKPALVLARTSFKIRDAAAVVVAVHVREDLADGSKRMFWRQPDGTPGLDGMPAADLPLYGVHELKDGPVVVVEGEKARDAAAGLGLNAVGTVTGAAGCPSLTALEALRDRDVYLWPDNDPPGHSHMARIVDRLDRLVRSAKVVSWPEAPDGGDAADFRGGAEAIGTLLEVAKIHSAQPLVGIRAEANLSNALPFRTARELAAMTPQEVSWRASPWLADEALTEVDGKVKVGKTSFALAMSRAILDGARFLGEPTKKSGVVMLTEQPCSSLLPALDRAGLLDREDFVLLLRHEAAGQDWPVIVDAAVAQAKKMGAAVLVVDTLSQWARLAGDAENSSGAALEACRPLQDAAAKHRLAVLILRHERKSGGDVGDSGRGSSAFAGAVDIVLSLRRPEGKTRPTVRVIQALSRFEETPPELVIERTANGYVSLGTEAAIVAAEVRHAIAGCLAGSSPAGRPIGDILNIVKESLPGASRTTVQRELSDLVRENRVVRGGGGKKGDPHVFSCPHVPLSAQASTSTRAEASGPSDLPTDPEQVVL